MSRPIKILETYEKEIKKVIVTYNDNSKKEFTPNEWYLFEEGVRKIAKEVKILNKTN